MVIKLLDAGKTRPFVGAEKDAEALLRQMFPTETENVHRFLACVEAVNRAGFAEVDVEPYRPPESANRLAADYHEPQDAKEDPWPREEP
jgi:hypothetical protein